MERNSRTAPRCAGDHMRTPTRCVTRRARACRRLGSPRRPRRAAPRSARCSSRRRAGGARRWPPRWRSSAATAVGWGRCCRRGVTSGPRRCATRSRRTSRWDRQRRRRPRRAAAGRRGATASAPWRCGPRRRTSASARGSSRSATRRRTGSRRLRGTSAREVRPLVVDDQTLDELLERAYATEDDGRGGRTRFRTSREEPAQELPDDHRRRAAARRVGRRLRCALGARWTASTTRWPSSRASRSSTPTTRATRTALAVAVPPAWVRVRRCGAGGGAARTALALRGVRGPAGRAGGRDRRRLAAAARLLRRSPRRTRRPPRARARVDVEDLLATWAAPGRGTTSCDTRALSRALGWEPPRHADAAAPRDTVWVCVPTYDEAANVERAAAGRSSRRARRPGSTARVLVIDDGSPDGTGAIAEALRATEPRLHVLHRRSKDGHRARPTSPASRARSTTAPTSSWRWTATSPTTRRSCRR